MKIKMISSVTSFMNYHDLGAGKIYEFPLEDARKLIENGLAEEVPTEFMGEGARKRVDAEARRPTLADFLPGKEGKPEGKPSAAAGAPESPQTTEGVGGGAGPRIDGRLIGWLQQHGFVRAPDGTAYSKTTLVGGENVKLCVDFKNTDRGARFGYRLDMGTDPPSWKNVPNLRDHPELLEFKAFRDKLFEAPKPTPKAPQEVPAGGAKVEVLATGEEVRREVMEIQIRDERQILEEMKGQVLDTYFYQFNLRGRTVTGLSYAGCRALAQRMGGLRISDLEIKETEKVWIATCKIHDVRRNLVLMGAAMQPKKMRLRDGSEVEDSFSFTKAVGKCQRNAIRACLPEQVITTMYEEWKARQK